MNYLTEIIIIFLILVSIQGLILLNKTILYRNYFNSKDVNQESFIFKKTISIKLRNLELSILYTSVSIFVFLILLLSVHFHFKINLLTVIVYIISLTALTTISFFSVKLISSVKNEKNSKGFFIMAMVLFLILSTISDAPNLFILLFMFGAIYGLLSDVLYLQFSNNDEIEYSVNLVFGKSMKPALIDDDTVLGVKNIGKSDLVPGDIVAYHSSMALNHEMPVIHRVQKINKNKIDIKGDNDKVEEKVGYYSIENIAIAVKRDSENFILDPKYNIYNDIINKFYDGELEFPNNIRNLRILNSTKLAALMISVVTVLIIYIILLF